MIKFDKLGRTWIFVPHQVVTSANKDLRGPICDDSKMATRSAPAIVRNGVMTTINGQKYMGKWGCFTLSRGPHFTPLTTISSGPHFEWLGHRGCFVFLFRVFSFPTSLGLFWLENTNVVVGGLWLWLFVRLFVGWLVVLVAAFC